MVFKVCRPPVVAENLVCRQSVNPQAENLDGDHYSDKNKQIDKDRNHHFRERKAGRTANAAGTQIGG